MRILIDFELEIWIRARQLFRPTPEPQPKSLKLFVIACFFVCFIVVFCICLLMCLSKIVVFLREIAIFDKKLFFSKQHKYV